MQFLQFDYFSRENCLVTEKFTFLVDLRSKFQFCDVVGLYSLLVVMILKSTTTKFHWLHSNPLFVSRKWFLLVCFGSHFVGNTQRFLAVDLQIEDNTRWANMPRWKWPKWWKRSRPLVPIWWSVQHRCQIHYRNLLHSLDCNQDCTQDCRNPKGYTEVKSLVIWIFAPKMKYLTSGLPKKILEICSGTSWIESRDSGLLSKPWSCPFAMTGSEELKFVCPTPCAYLKDMTQTFSCPFGKFLGVG